MCELEPGNLVGSQFVSRKFVGKLSVNIRAIFLQFDRIGTNHEWSEEVGMNVAAKHPKADSFLFRHKSIDGLGLRFESPELRV